MPTLDDTRDLVRQLFADKTDKNGAPYSAHCFRVEEGLPAWARDDERHAALLHDAVEDTPMTLEGLRALGYSERVLTLVEGLTHPPGGAYMDYVRSIARSRDRGLIAIKLGSGPIKVLAERGIS